MGQNFRYKARDQSGSLLKGTIEAQNRQAVVEQLKEQGYYISSVEPVEERTGIDLNLELFNIVSTKDLVLFSRQFATMVESGVSLLQCLNILTEQVANSKLQQAIAEVRTDVESGESLSTAMGKHPDVFPKLYVSMIEAGEVGGMLDQVLQEMADYFERQHELRQNVLSAIAYPAAITLVAIGVIMLLIIRIIPNFAGMLGGEAELPYPTQLVMGFSEGMAEYWYFAAGGLALVIGAVYFYYQTEPGKRQLDHLLLRLPLIGDLIMKVSITRFSSTLAVLLGNGVSILDSLEVVGKVIFNQTIVDRFKQARVEVSEGESLAAPLEKDRLFPPLVIQMIKVGEETGDLEGMLNRVANFYEREVSYKVEAMVSLIEPALIVILGGIVAILVAAVMLPMFDRIGTM